MEERNTKTYRHDYRLVIESRRLENGAYSYQRQIYFDGKLEYADSLKEELYWFSLEYPDLFRMLELFSMGKIPLNCQERDSDKCIWNMRGGKDNEISWGADNSCSPIKPLISEEDSSRSPGNPP